MMNSSDSAGKTVAAAGHLSRWQRRAPVLTLIVVSPVIAEVLSGSTRLSFLFVLIPEILVWGLGTLLIREAVRRSGRGGRSMLLLALALAVAEECIIQQTSLAPLPWAGPGYAYGRLFGVNWVWLLAMLGFESVWVVLVPVQLTELIFRSRRAQPWLHTGGPLTSGVLFILGCCVAWYGWTQRARPLIYHAPEYQPPPATMLLAAVAIVALIVLGYRVRTPGRERAGFAPQPWLAGLIVFLLAEGWVFLIALASGGRTAFPFVWVIFAGLAWAATAYLAIERWSRSAAWADVHRLAAVGGAIAAILSGGWQGTWLTGDMILRVVLGAAAILLIAALARRLSAESRSGMCVPKGSQT
jgi:hypothetical protein